MSVCLFTGLHFQKAYHTHSGTSSFKCVYQICYIKQLWCTHWGQEEPKLVFTFFAIRAFQFLFLFPARGRVAFQASEKEEKTKLLWN